MINDPVSTMPTQAVLLGGVQTETDEARETAGRASCLAMPVCDAFSIAKIKTGRKRHLPQFHRAETAGLYGTSVPTAS